LDDDAAGTDDPRVAVIARDLVLLEQRLDALRQAINDLVLAFQHRHEVELDAVGDHTVLGKPAPRRDVVFARLEQYLAGDAADAQARPAERRFSLDHRDIEPKLRRPDCGYIPTGPGADHNQIVLLHVPLPC